MFRRDASRGPSRGPTGAQLAPQGRTFAGVAGSPPMPAHECRGGDRGGAGPALRTGGPGVGLAGRRTVVAGFALRDLGGFVHRTLVEDPATYAVRIDDGALLDAHA